MVDFAQARTMMVDTQVRPNDVTIYPIIAAMLDVPREAFVPDARQAVAYMGENVRLSDERWLLEPRNFAKLLEALREIIAQGHAPAVGFALQGGSQAVFVQR